MQEQRPVLSICLPTNGVVEWVIPTLESIYAQNVNFSLFEVVISDNGETTEKVIGHFLVSKSDGKIYPDAEFDYETREATFGDELQ